MTATGRTAGDVRAAASAGQADPAVAGLWRDLMDVAGQGPRQMGLAAGERPAADVEVLAGVLAAAEYAVAAWLHAAEAAGCVPLPGPGGMLLARGWSTGWARRLARCAALADAHPPLAAVWAAGVVTSDHLDPIARAADRFTTEELHAVIAELGPHWGAWSPAAVARFVTAAERMLHPPPDPAADEADAYESRALSFSVTGDTVLLSGALPRVEGELVIAAIDALAERLRSTADHVPAAARRADALVQLVNTAHASGALPMRGGLPVALSVTLEHTRLGDPIWATSRGHHCTPAEQRWAACDASVTPILVQPTSGCDGPQKDAAPSIDPSAGVHAEAGLHPADAGAHPADAGPPGSTGPAAGSYPENAGATEASPAPAASAGRPEPAAPSAEPDRPPGPGARIAALAELLFDTRLPLAVGRTQRTATAAQRRALAARDRGCIIPGCGIPAEACQAHHLTDWAAGGDTDLANLALLCWAHHRQVDLHMWTIQPHAPGTTPPPRPDSGAPPATPWPANHGAPLTITRTPRNRWRQ